VRQEKRKIQRKEGGIIFSLSATPVFKIAAKQFLSLASTTTTKFENYRQFHQHCTHTFLVQKHIFGTKILYESCILGLKFLAPKFCTKMRA